MTSPPRPRALAALLDAYLAVDPLEASHLARMRHLLAKGDDALARHHYAPGHFTASAFVLSPDRTELLLILHGKLGLWLQPGGHFEPADATPEGAARREVLEEVGLDDLECLGEGLFDIDVHEIPATPKAPRHEHHDVRFLFAARTRAVTAGDDASAARWVSVAKLLDGSAPDELVRDASVMRAVRRLSSRGAKP